MKTIEARHWTPGMNAYIWTEPGEGSLLKVTGIRADWWIVTGYCSWCCCPDTKLYILDTEEEVKNHETGLQQNLAHRRKYWNTPGYMTPPYNPIPTPPYTHATA